LANIHIGTIAGKLNGVMPATTPSGWRIEYTSTPVDGLLAVAALQQVRDAARELDVLEAAGDLAQRVGQHLSVLGGEQRGDLLAVGVDQFAQAEQDLGASRQAGRNATRETPPGRGDGGVDLSADARSTAPICSPVAGL
jgi:hypothetical protein